MMALPDSDHVARYCGDQKCPGGDVQATAFMRRSRETGLSVNWLEYYVDCVDRRQALARVVQALEQKGRSIGARSWMAILNVGRARHKVRTESEPPVELEFVHVPQLSDESHAEIRGMAAGDEFVGELLAEAAREESPCLIASLRQPRPPERPIS
jgi:hypothetical protein